MSGKVSFFSCARALAVCVLASFNLTAAFADDSNLPDKRFYYQIKLPQTNRSCEQEAVELAQRFSEVTGLKVIDRVCKGTLELPDGDAKYSVYSVMLTYLAKREAHPYSVFFGNAFMDVPGASTGIYPTYAACLSNLERQAALFEGQTGYRAVAATCQEGSYSYEKTFVLRIDGFSSDPQLKEPKLRLYSFTAMFRGQADATLWTTVEHVVARLGAQVATSGRNAVFYYSKYPLPVRYEYLGEFILAEECASQLDEARAIFSNLGSKMVIARCLADKDPKFAGRATLEIVRDRASGDPSYVTNESQYYSYSECLNDRARLMDEASSRGYTPLGVLCRKTWSDKYEAQLFKKLF